MNVVNISKIRFLMSLIFTIKSAKPAKKMLRKADRENVRKKLDKLITKTEINNHVGIFDKIVSCGTFLSPRLFCI